MWHGDVKRFWAYTGEANMLANDARDISVTHRDYDGWIKAELDRGLKGLI